MGLKLSDLDPKDYQFVDEPGKKSLKLSDLKAGDYQFVEPHHASQLESVGRGLAQGSTFGLEPTMAGIGGVVGDAAGKMGVDKVESPNPDVQAKLDQISSNTPSSNDIYLKTKREEDTANDQARDENPMSYLAGEAAPLTAKLGPAVLAAGRQIPVGNLVKSAIAAKFGFPGKLATMAGDALLNPIAERVAQRVAAQSAPAAVEAAAPLAESVIPAVKSLGRKFDPFTKKYIGATGGMALGASMLGSSDAMASELNSNRAPSAPAHNENSYLPSDPTDFDPQSAAAMPWTKTLTKPVVDTAGEAVDNIVTGEGLKKSLASAMTPEGSLNMAMGSLEVPKIGKVGNEIGQEAAGALESPIRSPKPSDHGPKPTGNFSTEFYDGTDNSERANKVRDAIEKRNLSFFDQGSFKNQVVSANEDGDVRGALGIGPNNVTESAKVHDQARRQGINSDLYQTALDNLKILRSSPDQTSSGRAFWDAKAKENPYHIKTARDPETLIPKSADYKVWEQDTNVPLRKKEMDIENTVDEKRSQLTDAEDLSTSKLRQAKLDSLEQSFISTNDRHSRYQDALSELAQQNKLPLERALKGNTGIREIDNLSDIVKSLDSQRNTLNDEHMALQDKFNSGDVVNSDVDNLRDQIKKLIKKHQALIKKSGHTMFGIGGIGASQLDSDSDL